MQILMRGFFFLIRGSAFDPLNQAAAAAGGSSSSPAFEATKREETPEEKIKALEKRVTELIEESCLAAGRGDLKVSFLYLFLKMWLLFKNFKEMF